MTVGFGLVGRFLISLLGPGDADAGVKTWGGLPADADAFLVFEAAD